MARVTVEDCIDKVSNRFELVLLAAHRARMISGGVEPSLDRDNDKNPVLALREIADETLTTEQLKNDLIEEYQTSPFSEDEELNEIEDGRDENQSDLDASDTIEDNQEYEKTNQLAEETPTETSQDNLENSSDEDKAQEI